MDKNAENIIQFLEKEFNGDENHDVEVLRTYCRSLERTKENLATVTYIGRYAAEHFPNADAIKEAKKFEEEVGHFMDLTTKAQQCMKEKKFEEALETFKELVGEVKPPENVDRTYCSFLHPFEEMIYRSMHQDVTNLERISTLPQVVYSQIGAAHFELKQYDEAKEAYRNALKLSPVCPMLHFELIQIAKAQNDIDEVRRILKEIHCFLYTRPQLAHFYREYANLALMQEKCDLARALIYLSIDYADSPIARAQLNSLAKHRGTDLSKPSIEFVKDRLAEAEIPLGPAPNTYEMAMYIGRQMKRAYPDVARMAFEIAYDLTHYQPLLKEIESCQ